MNTVHIVPDGNNWLVVLERENDVMLLTQTYESAKHWAHGYAEHQKYEIIDHIQSPQKISYSNPTFLSTYYQPEI